MWVGVGVCVCGVCGVCVLSMLRCVVVCGCECIHTYMHVCYCGVCILCMCIAGIRRAGTLAKVCPHAQP